MAEKKKQHYISQFLLKNFSSDINRKTIHLFNRVINKMVLAAPIKGQAQENNFYGADKIIEDFLGAIEQKASQIIRRILTSGHMPDYKDKEYAYLLHFIMFYAFRTKANVKNSEKYLNDLFRNFSKYEKRLKQIDFDKYKIAHPEPAAFNISRIIHDWVITYDLNSVLLVNDTENPFLISDNPFIRYNPFMLQRSDYGGAGGLINKGITLFFPISPFRCLLFYDPWAYTVQQDGKRNLKISNYSDIEKINILQSISADRIIYFSPEATKEYLTRIAEEGKIHKLNETYSEVVVLKGQPERKFLYSYHLEHKLNMDFSFILENEAAQQEYRSGDISYPRNQEIVDWLEMDKGELLNQDLQN